MKILMTADPIGGVWNYALELCAALAARRAHVSLATLGAELSPAQREQIGRLSNVTLYESSFRLEWMPQPWDDLDRAGGWLLSLEQEIGPDIVHLNHLVHADLPWNTPVLSVGHSCVVSWWAAVHNVPLPPEWAIYRRRVTSSLQAARCVVAPTQVMLADLERYYGPFRHAAVVYNARNRRLFSAGHKERMVLSAGRIWDPAKNIGALAAVAPRVAAPILVAGETTGPEGNVVAAPPAVRLLGSLHSDALAAWYARAAVYALPARYEPFGLTALEAALSGCAIVLGDIDSLREIWGAAARYVAPDDHEALRDTLNELLANDSLRRRLAARAMARARQFAPARLALEYLTLYRKLLEENRGGHDGPQARTAAARTAVHRS
ncbi:MAG: glycosyl transferase family 1 [Gammaproteobacteria bacterium]|nr:glycosyl transferase family 1 [Gammaproteobacteria bacterium]